MSTAYSEGMSLVNEDPQHGSPFLRLPPELRMMIYRELLGDKTIHIDGTTHNPQRRYKLSYKRFTAERHMNSLTRLTGAGHSQAMLSTTDYNAWEPCDSNFIGRMSGWCGQKLSLGAQLLRVCRQIYNEAAHILSAENYFIITGGLHAHFLKAFLKQWGIKQRRAVRIAAIFNLPLSFVERGPIVLPGLQHLWIGLGELYYHRKPNPRSRLQMGILKRSFS